MSAICGICNVLCSDVKKSVKCSGTCAKVFHIDCVNLKFPDSLKTRHSKREWFCDDCKVMKPASNSSSRSVESTQITKEFLVNVMEAFKKEVFEEFKKHSTQFNDFQSSLEFFSNKIDEASKVMESIKLQNQTILKENDALKKKNVELSKNFNELESKVRDLEQYSRRENIEVNGVPQTRGENEKDILRDLGKAIGVEVDANSVVAVHRVPAFNKARTPALIARFTTRELRDTWLQKYREKKTLMACDINRNFPASRVYIGEHLTPDNKLLLRNMKEEGKHLGVKYVWCREGRFYARRSEGDNSVRVYGVGHLREVDWDALVRK